MKDGMRRFAWLGGAVLGAALFALASPAAARAQVRAGDVRLHLDLGLVNWTSARARGEFAGDDARLKDNLLLAGTTAGGIGVGYVLSAHIVPGLYFGLQHGKYTQILDTDDDERELRDSTERRFELRPYLEVPFNPSSRFVLHGLVGLSLQRRVAPEPGDFEAFAVGPIFGVGGHGFVTSKASLDISLAFRTAFVKSDDLEDAAEAMLDDVKLRELALIFSIGASFWL